MISQTEFSNFTKNLDISKISRWYTNQMEAHSEEFRLCRENCQAALAHRDNLFETLEKGLASEILYSLWLGFLANLTHFRDPGAPTFMEQEPECYLQEKHAQTLPLYTQATEALAGTELTPEQWDIVNEYRAFADCTIPKLAHYHGFCAGDALLPLMEPGYQPDPFLRLTYQYRLAALLDAEFRELLDPFFCS